MSIYLGTQRLATNIAGDTSTSLPLAGGALTGDLTFSNIGDGIIFQPGTTGTVTVSSNTLDDYERGSFIPDLFNIAISSTSHAEYTKIGDLVHVTMSLGFGPGTSSAITQFQDFPFAATIGEDQIGVMRVVKNSAVSTFYVIANGSAFNVFSATGTSEFIDGTALTNGTGILTMTYRTNA